ncbi:MAG: glycosyltransferase family 4 protein [Bacteroidetes bacterium]|nr:glycosyltransferase family 4 protein [Bacteroidota bacterium]
MSKLVIHAWTISKKEGEYYLPYCHWIYLTQLSVMYEEICLLCPVNENNNAEREKLLSIKSMKNIWVYELPAAKSYMDSFPHFGSYVKAYKKLKSFDEVYVRYPVPYGWLCRRYFKSKRIIHLVGDPIEVTWNNSNLSRFKRLLKIGFFLPEYMAYMWACRASIVYTEGPRLLKKIERFGVKGKSVYSSTLIPGDFKFDSDKRINKQDIRILHVGYLRKWKGVEIVIESFKSVQEKFTNAKLTIIGGGEFEQDLKLLTRKLGIEQKVQFLGHIEDRDELNRHYRNHDVFCLTSVSEGSPRVIIEAMANGLNVICTPTGSLPFVFEHNKDILFVNFNSPEDLTEKIYRIAEDSQNAVQLRTKAFNKVKELDMKNFLNSVFQ